MTMKLELKPEIEAGLAAQAHACGLSLEAYLDRVLQSAATPDGVVVVPHGDEWIVKQNVSGGRASAILPTQALAIERAKELAGRGEIHVRKRPAGRKSLSQLFAESPFKGLDLDFERDPDTGRPVGL